MPTTGDPRAGRLAVLDDPNTDFPFHFTLQANNISHLAPNVFKRRNLTNYATTGVALSALQPREFRAISAVELTIEFEIVGAGQLSVVPSLRKLYKLAAKDRRTGEPPDVIFELGSRSWVVRIDSIEEVPRLWNNNADEQRVHIVMQMHTVQKEGRN